jgi:Uma2 family endonuclease
MLAPLSLPETLTGSLRLTPEQFAEFCTANPDAVLELAADGSLITMTPTGGETGARNSTLAFLLQLAIRHSGLPLKLFDSSTGFRLGDGSVLSPDAALVNLDRWQALDAVERRSFPPLCPDLVVELASPSDEGPRGLTALRRKLTAYQANGASLGWLLIHEQRAVEIWGPLAGRAQSPRRIEPADRLDGAPLFPAAPAPAGVVAWCAGRSAQSPSPAAAPIAELGQGLQRQQQRLGGVSPAAAWRRDSRHGPRSGSRAGASGGCPHAASRGMAR